MGGLKKGNKKRGSTHPVGWLDGPDLSSWLSLGAQPCVCALDESAGERGGGCSLLTLVEREIERTSLVFVGACPIFTYTPSPGWLGDVFGRYVWGMCLGWTAA